MSLSQEISLLLLGSFFLQSGYGASSIETHNNISIERPIATPEDRIVDDLFQRLDSNFFSVPAFREPDDLQFRWDELMKRVFPDISSNKPTIPRRPMDRQSDLSLFLEASK